MSKNIKIALGVIRSVNHLHNRAMIRAAKEALRLAIENTIQDSGEAAYNWKWTINGYTQRQRFLKREGIAPVHVKKKDGSGYVNQHPEIAKIRVKELELAAKEFDRIRSIMIYHPLSPDSPTYYRYVINADLETAAIIASNEGYLLHSVAEEIRRHR